jgi:hypothetical protein
MYLSNPMFIDSFDILLRGSRDIMFPECWLLEAADGGSE